MNKDENKTITKGRAATEKTLKSLSKTFSAAVRGGKNKVYRNVVSEAITLDDGWISTVENYIYSIENIVKNPKKFISDEDLIVNVERAKRTTVRAVRHLSANSHYVVSVDKEGFVRPRKVLATESDEELAIYENRFVYSLVSLLTTFVESRYNDITGKMHAFDQSGAGIISSFPLGKSDCEIKLNVKVKEPPKDKVLVQKNNEILERIENIRLRLKTLMNTAFIKSLSAKKPVRPPIVKTNLIRLNTDYNNCYKLWVYISKYTFVGATVKYREKNLPVNAELYGNLVAACVKGLKALLTDDALTCEDYSGLKNKTIKEKKFRLLTAYKFEPEFISDPQKAGAEAINEYYFKAMRDELVRAAAARGATTEKEITLSFARFCRGIARINREMYKDLILSYTKEKPPAPQDTALKKKAEELKAQKALVKRLKHLSGLKREEFEIILKNETRERLKLERLTAKLDKVRGRKEDERERKRKAAERAAKIMAKKTAAEKKVTDYEVGLRTKIDEKVAAAEEKRRLRREELRRERDLNRLKELKELYGEKG